MILLNVFWIQNIKSVADGFGFEFCSQNNIWPWFLLASVADPDPNEFAGSAR